MPNISVDETVREWKRGWGTVETRRCSSGYRVGRVRIGGEKLILSFLGDLHLGSPNFDEPAFDKTVEWIRDSGALWVGMGDLIECATKTSIGAGVYDQVLTPQEQIERVPEKLRPISHLCVGMISGNHEERAYKMAGVDPTALIAAALDVPYFGWEAWLLFVQAERTRRSWTCYAVHSGTGNKSGGLALAWTDREIRKYASVDVIARAHSHDLGFLPAERLVLNKSGINPSVDLKPQALVSTGHFLKRADSYAAGKAAGTKPGGALALDLPLREIDRSGPIQVTYLPLGRGPE